MDNEQKEYNLKADELVRQAQAKPHETGFWTFMTGKEHKFREAIQLFEEAIINYKLAKNCFFIRDQLCDSLFFNRQTPKNIEGEERKGKILHFRRRTVH